VREAIKEIGKHSVPVKLHREVVAKITVDVIAQTAPEEAEEQLEGGPEEPRERRRGRRRDRDEEEESEAAEASEERADSDED